MLRISGSSSVVREVDPVEARVEPSRKLGERRVEKTGEARVRHLDARRKLVVEVERRTSPWGSISIRGRGE